MSISRRSLTSATTTVGLVACLLIGASCSSGSSTSSSSSSDTTGTSAPRTTTSSSLPVGYSVFSDHTDRFRIAVPRAWRQIDPSSPGASQSFAAALESNPGLKSMLGSNPANLVAQGIKFLALDISDGDSVNVDVRSAPGGRDSDLADLVDVLKQQYAAAGIDVTDTSTISLAGHKALHVVVVAHLVDASGAQHTRNEVQDVVVANDLVYTVTYAGESGEFPSIRSTFDVSS
jgi:hypothetical protein